MKRFRDLAIGRKLMLAMMLTSTTAILVAGIASILYEVTAFRKVSVRDLSAQAEIIGENCAAALEFDNPQTAQETIASLKARSDIVIACVYRKDGSVLARYPFEAMTFPVMETDGQRIVGGHLLLFHRIIRKGEALGTVFLRSNLSQHYARMIAGIAIALGSMTVAWVLALALAARLKRRIANPIMDLAGMAERVRNQQDYSLRTERLAEDEIGVLTDGFNRMLEDIQERDVKLQQAYAELKSSEEALRKLSLRLLRSQDEERRRIARELHDSTGQKLVAVSMHLSAINDAIDALDPAAQQALTSSFTVLDECAREIRTLSYLLHPPLLDERGLASALAWYIEGFTQRSGITVDLDIPSDLQRLPQEVEMALFRIVQEGLGNIHRHSGSSTAAIHVGKNSTNIHLEMQDSGKGIAAQRVNGLPIVMGVGFTSMRERVQQLRGQMEVQSDFRGTIIRVILPVDGAAS